MKSRIQKAYPESTFGMTKAEKIYVTDFTKRTSHERGVEISEVLPKDPNDSTVDMDCCVVLNTNVLSVDYNVT